MKNEAKRTWPFALLLGQLALWGCGDGPAEPVAPTLAPPLPTPAADAHATERHEVRVPVFVDNEIVLRGRDADSVQLSGLTLEAVVGFSAYLKRPWLSKAKRFQRLDLPDTIRARWFASRPGRDTAHVKADFHLPRLEWGDGAYEIRIDSVKADSTAGYVGATRFAFLPGWPWADSTAEVAARATWHTFPLAPPKVDTTTTDDDPGDDDPGDDDDPDDGLPACDVFSASAIRWQPRTGGISGRVSAEGRALADVQVHLGGTVSDETTTNDAGQYAFTGLAAGPYTVTIRGYQDKGVRFLDDVARIDLSDDQGAIVNFVGRWVRRSLIVGSAFVDLNGNGEPDDGEARCRNFAVVLQGPGVADVHSLLTNSFGGYAFGGLAEGSYRVLSSVADSTLARLGLRFAGLQTGVPVVLDPLSTETVNLPFDIR